MKKILLTLIILISLTACESKKSNSIEKNVEEYEETTSDSETELTELEKEEKLRAEIDDQYLAELSKCSQNINAVTDFNGKTEFWRICDLENGNRIIQIELYDSELLFKEVYFELNGKLRYIKRTEEFFPKKNKFSQKSLRYDWYFENEELVAISFNNGDIDNHLYSAIIEIYNERISELNRIEK